METLKDMTVRKIKSHILFFLGIIIINAIFTIALVINPTETMAILTLILLEPINLIIPGFLITIAISKSRVNLLESIQIGNNRKTFVFSQLLTIFLYSFALAIILTPLSSVVNKVGLIYENPSFLNMKFYLTTYFSFFGKSYGYDNMFLLTLITGLGYSLFSITVMLLVQPYLITKKYIKVLITNLVAMTSVVLISNLYFAIKNRDLFNVIFGYNGNNVNIGIPIIVFSSFILLFSLVYYFSISRLDIA